MKHIDYIDLNDKLNTIYIILKLNSKQIMIFVKIMKNIKMIKSVPIT